MPWKPEEAVSSPHGRLVASYFKIILVRRDKGLIPSATGVSPHVTSF